MNSIYKQVKSSGMAAIALTMLAAVFLLAGIAIPAQAQTESVLYSFQGNPNGSGPDGSWPKAGPILVGTTLYGTTLMGGAYGLGSVWAVSTTTGKETILYSFQGGASDGEYPYGGLAYYKGSLYGTTCCGPSPGYQGGIIFKLTKQGKKYVETILHEFTGADGSDPLYVVPVFDKAGNLYGTTSTGGAYSGGVVFKMSQSGDITVLHHFDPYAQNPYDGFTPIGGVWLDKKGNLYGQTNGGGTYDWGTVYEITAAGGYNILFNFDQADGYNAYAPPVLDKKGNLWGTAEDGGSDCGGCYGTVYKLNPKTGQMTIIYQFTGGYDGANPFAGPLVFDKEGNLYGTSGEGAAECGTIYKVTPAGALTYLYNFTCQPDGFNPLGSVVFDKSGNIYTTTNAGGTNNVGAVIKLTP